MMRDEIVAGNNIDINIPIDDFKAFINDFPALLWRIEITRSRIEFLNNHSIGKLGSDAQLFLKNTDFRNKILLSEDAHLLDGFMEAVKEGKTASTVFRVHDRTGSKVWLKLTGATNSCNPKYYYGYLLDVSDTVRVIRSIVDNDMELQTMLEKNSFPALLANAENGSILKVNEKMSSLFGRTPKAMERNKLSELMPRSMNKMIQHIRAEVPFSREWAGKLDYCAERGMITAQTEVQYMMHGDLKLLLIELLNPEIIQKNTNKNNGIDCSKDFSLQKAIEGVESMDDIMHKALESPMIDGKYDGVMFSDVQIRKNKVVVFGAGEPFAIIPKGETFSYKGTIAEDIERYELDHLVVDDTQDSIKPIDWALFIPRGIRSYFAKPYYVRGVLRTVLIVCSTEPGRFSGKEATAFDTFFSPLADAAKTWRRRKRQGK
ncbi:MAG: hypothetical protein JEY79_11530 [Pseudodesulfovibrio sp.]|nr:hypothetical protein [Pseudodesulfovibrio sp.]